MVERLNLRYQQTPDSQLYFTIVYAVLNTQTGKLRYCTGGHPKFLWRHQSEATIDMVGDENFYSRRVSTNAIQGRGNYVSTKRLDLVLF